MKRLLILFVCMALLFGCAGQRFKSDLRSALQPAVLRSQFNTQPINLKELSKCAETSVNIINVEKVNEDINSVPGAIFSPSWKINPQELTGEIIDYAANSYRQCRVFIDKSSKKIIHLSMEKIEGFPTGIFRFTSYSHLKMKVSIPEMNHTEIFTSNQSSPYLYDAMASSIHDITWQIINDAVIQDYITCQ